MVIIAAADEECRRDLTDELGCFMEELGYDPQLIESVEADIMF
jgi:hypothetical protein